MVLSASYISNWSAKCDGDSGVAVASAPRESFGLLNRFGTLPAPRATSSAVVTLPLDPGGRMFSVAPSASYGRCAAEAVLAATAGPTASDDTAARTSRRRMGGPPGRSDGPTVLRRDRLLSCRSVVSAPSPPSDPGRRR